MRIVRDILLYGLAFVLLLLVPLLEVAGIGNQTLLSRSTYYQAMLDEQSREALWDTVVTSLEDYAGDNGLSAETLVGSLDRDALWRFQWRQWSALFDLIEGQSVASREPLDLPLLDEAVSDGSLTAQARDDVRGLVEAALAPVDVASLAASGQLDQLRGGVKAVRWTAMGALAALVAVELLMLLLLRRHKMHFFWWNGSVLIVDSLVMGVLAQWALTTGLPERLAGTLPALSLVLGTVLRGALRSLFTIQIGTFAIGLAMMVLYLVYRRSYRV